MLIMSVVAALVFAWLSWSRLRVLFHDVDDAVAYVHKRLDAREAAVRNVLIDVWESRPLTEHQIKELAAAKGFRYQRDNAGSTFRTLAFERRRRNVR